MSFGTYNSLKTLNLYQNNRFYLELNTYQNLGILTREITNEIDRFNTSIKEIGIPDFSFNEISAWTTNGYANAWGRRELSEFTISFNNYTINSSNITLWHLFRNVINSSASDFRDSFLFRANVYSKTRGATSPNLFIVNLPKLYLSQVSGLTFEAEGGNQVQNFSVTFKVILDEGDYEKINIPGA